MSRSATELMGIPEESFYWIPGEMVVVIRLPHRLTENDLDTLVEQVRSQLNALLTSHQLRLEPYGTYGRWHVEPTRPPVRRRAFLFGLRRRQPFAAIFFHVRHADPAVEDPMPMALSYLQGQLERLAQAGLHLVSAMPNWLVIAAPASTLYSTGGPAFPPKPAPPLDLPATTSATPLGWRYSLIDRVIPLDPGGAADAVVAVLDTALHPDRLRSAAALPERRRNWLLQRLASNVRGEGSPFEIEYDRRYYVTGDTRTGRDAANNPRYYPMPDHGIFVAGIIRDLAPRASIRLIRILNDFGGGDLYNLFAALTDLEQELVSGSIRHLVINLSLTIMPEIRRLPYVWLDENKWPTRQLPGLMRVLNHIEEGLRLLFECLYAEGVLVVAAAGNDSFSAAQKGKPRHPPRAPARYETTLGVTAINSHLGPSLFANAASMPPFNTGVATFGGDHAGLQGIDGLPDAVRGIYISPTFPGGEQNISGWADWSGTSFAAPVISALGAHLLAQGLRVPDIMARITAGHRHGSEKLFGDIPDVPPLLANIIRVRQAFG